MRRIVSVAAALAVGLVFGSSAGTSAADKVTVCHKGNEIEVAQSAVGAHLGHGDKLGSCTAPPPCSSSGCSLAADAGTLTIE